MLFSGRTVSHGSNGFSIDNSDWSRNGDYRPTRLDAQLDTSLPFALHPYF